MLKATAWPYPVFDDVRYSLDSVKFGQISFEACESAAGLVVDCGSLRERNDGSIQVGLKIETACEEVIAHVFDAARRTSVTPGVRVLCKESKFRKFFEADGNGQVAVEIPINRLRGVAQLDVLFLASGNATANNSVSVSRGVVVGVSSQPIVLTVDEDWTGDTLPVDWLDFSANNLPKEAFVHVELSGGSQTPKVWLNAKYRGQIETVLLRTGDNSPAALAGASMRVFLWQQIWEKVLIWALREESADQEKWPATRIAKMWRSNFSENEWELPNVDNLDVHGMIELSVRIQHCLLVAQNLSRINGILRFQPEARGSA
ncbi:MAG: hypothetical protein HY298_14100 [Verrucomicrobia bacterium]|nr:hypothetical protein [Verrucomicrobiota bacterium]